MTIIHKVHRYQATDAQSSQVKNGNDTQSSQVTNDDNTRSSQVTSDSNAQSSQVTNDNDAQSSQVTSGNDTQVNEDGQVSSEKRGRKRKRNVNSWKRSINKRRHNEGKSCTARSGKTKSARKMKPGCGHGCRYKCQSKFDESERQTLFHSYWQLGDVYKQKQFIAKFASIKVKGKNKLNSGSRRKWTVTYTLPQRQEDGACTSVKVCKTFFSAHIWV